MLIAGLSKFVILDFWLGYEPRFVVEVLPIAAKQLTLLGGFFEAALGILLLSGRKTFYTAFVTFSWLLMITLQMINLGFWDLAVRDLGLTFYAFNTAFRAYRDR